ncbi:MAG: CHAT domain-containing protein, partial [Chlorobiaceae bacterium]|nr:CHAT domain-containing protein [Chlorobiaceae bacterium]
LVPHGFLHFLPLHALKLNGDFLIRQHTVSYAPSASVLKFLQRKGRDRLEHCIAFGVALDGEDERALPTLPPDRQAMAYHMRTIFELEAREVSDLFAGQCLTGSQVTQEKVRQGCIGQDLVHFSCHGRFDGQNPLESGLKLYDSMLTTRQIFNLKLDAELVVLSACLTGLNCRRAGDDLLGLTRAFLYAGAASLLVSLWPVNSESTREFMVNFFQRLKKGDDKAAALQQAQLYLIKKYQNPFYWAPFVLVGDWEV